jgi:hypothetical protein
MTTFHRNDEVITPDGRGHIQEIVGPNLYRVMITRDRFHGTLPLHFTEKSPTVSQNYESEELSNV